MRGREALESLIKLNFDPNQKDELGYNAIDLAFRGNHLHCAALLWERGCLPANEVIRNQQRNIDWQAELMVYMAEKNKNNLNSILPNPVLTKAPTTTRL